MVHRNLCSWVDDLGKERSDTGSVLVACRARVSLPAAQRAEGAPADAWQWRIMFLSGTCYNPRVSDWTIRKFEDPTQMVVEVLGLPCDLVVDTSPCLITGHGPHLRCLSSGELVRLLSEQQDLQQVELFVVEYVIVGGDDGGALKRIRIEGFEGPPSLHPPARKPRRARQRCSGALVVDRRPAEPGPTSASSQRSEGQARW